MGHIDAQLAFWFMVAVQVAGLASACLARASLGGNAQVSCQRVFLGCLALVSTATMLSLALSHASWLVCSTTLSLMILSAVWDFGQRTEFEVS